MEELVALLKQARQDKQVTLKEISDQTKIQLRYLEALESNDFSVFAGEVYLKGAICNYAETVGLDVREVLVLYHRLKGKAAAEPGPDPHVQEQPCRIKTIRGLKAERQGPSLTAGVVVLVLLLIIAGAWLTAKNWPREDTAAEETVPVENDMNGDPENGTETVGEPAPAPEVIAVSTSAGEIVFTVSGFTEIELALAFDAPCWIQVMADGTELFYPRTFQRGETYTATAENRIWLRMGYPPGVIVTVNGIEIMENRDFTTPHNFVFTLD